MISFLISNFSFFQASGFFMSFLKNIVSHEGSAHAPTNPVVTLSATYLNAFALARKQRENGDANRNFASFGGHW